MIDFIDKCGVRGTSNCYEEEQIRANPNQDQPSWFWVVVSEVDL